MSYLGALYLSAAMSFCGFSESQQENILEAAYLAHCDVDVENAASAKEALLLLDKQLQACFIDEGIERQQISDKIKDAEIREQILAKLPFFLEEINEGNEVPIKFIVGASQPTAEKRLKHGVTGGVAEEVYLLGSGRKLWPIHESMTAILVAERLAALQNIDMIEAKKIVDDKFAEIFVKANEMRDNRENYTDKEFTEETNRCRAQAVKYFTDLGIIWPEEADMMARISEFYQEEYPEILFKSASPAKYKLENGVSRRANTTDTVSEVWKDYGDYLSGKALNQPNLKLEIAMVTEQPYVYSHKMQISDTLADKPLEIKTMARGADLEKINVSLLLAEVARVFYICKKRDLSKLDTAGICPWDYRLDNL